MDNELKRLMQARDDIVKNSGVEITQEIQQQVQTLATGYAKGDPNVLEGVKHEHEIERKAELFTLYMGLYEDIAQDLPIQLEYLYSALAKNNVVQRGWTVKENIENIGLSVDKTFQNLVSGASKVKPIKTFFSQAASKLTNLLEKQEEHENKKLKHTVRAYQEILAVHKKRITNAQLKRQRKQERRKGAKT